MVGLLQAEYKAKGRIGKIRPLPTLVALPKTPIHTPTQVL
jgi:hypothetical protein